MPFIDVNLTPTVNTEATPADNETGISASNYIRWLANLPQKRGGCTLLINQQLRGVPRAIKPWAAIEGAKLLAVATTTDVWAYDSNTVNPLFDPNPFSMSPQVIGQPLYTDYTPVNVPLYNADGTVVSSPVLKTTAGSSIVEVFDTLATPTNRVALSIYDAVTFNTPVSIGGLIIQGTYPIVIAGGVTSYYIDVGYPAQTTTDTTKNQNPYVPQFVVTSGSSVVQVNFPIQYQYGTLSVGDRIGFYPDTQVGGITVGGQFLVQTVSDQGTSFTVVETKAATSNGSQYMNNGFISLTYWITQGPETQGSGYGINPYGYGPYGRGLPLTPVVGQKYSNNNWYLDNRGESLIACAVNGPIFYWYPDSGYSNLSIQWGAPTVNAGAFVAMPYGHIMAWGCSSPINPYPDPLFIRWCSHSDPNQWSISGQNGNNDAGFFTIPTGSKIVRGIQGQTQQYWFTDIDVYVAQYVGYPNVYQFNKVGNGCGLVAPKAAVLSGSNIYWMSQRQFFVVPAGGSPQALQCPVWDFIFQNMNQGIDPVSGLSYQQEVIAAANSIFNEVSWYFKTNQVDEAGDYLTGYVCFNTLYQEWDYGYLDRTAWTDQSIIGPSIGADSNGWVYQHETSNNLAVGTTTQPIDAWFQTGYSSLANGQELAFVDWILPDFKWAMYDVAHPTFGNGTTGTPDLYISATLELTFYVTDYAGQQPRVYGPYSCTKDTQYISTRFRGRFVSMKVQSTDLDSFWRLGSIRYRVAPAGRR